jgi:hypothetical protein
LHGAGWGTGVNDPRGISWSEPELEVAVRRYLAEHPKAMDTAEGIAEWWMMRERIRVDFDALLCVLRHLIDQGVLEKIGSGDHARYRLKHSSPR